jgi:hypothetical protein
MRQKGKGKVEQEEEWSTEGKEKWNKKEEEGSSSEGKEN